ncbi:MAG: sigma 54-interacting transcriptional regulator [Deltaproteobacteria bacterium]|nr:sigma 54-interacting transcriptional regulator [Deltaproteobacteria bacterium]
MSQPSVHTVQLPSNDGTVVLRRRRLRLEVVRGPDRKRRVELDLDRVVIGTHERCDLSLTDPTVSRQHLEIQLGPHGYAIRDLDSLNGVHIDSMRVRDVVVTRGVTLTLGETRVKMTLLDDTVDIPLPSQTRCGPLLGRSPAMRRVFELVRKVSATDATVLLSGESGTGKEVAARAVHECSRRASGPFVVVDCAALPPTLIESELYGHERGAFTGAERARTGAFEAAAGGTLFLDEIGELPLDLQTRLLGVIERREVQPLGSSRARKINVRLVAATNRDLRREVNRETFRADLYFRLAVVELHMPPLRERPEDIPLYVESFLADQAAGGLSFTVDPITIAELTKRTWPGNVRELRNVLERAAALGDIEPAPPGGGVPPVVSPDPDEVDPFVTRLAIAIDPGVPFKTAKGLMIGRYEQLYVEALMRKHNSNMTRAARAAEIDRVYLLRLLDKFDMRPTRQKK